MLKITALVALCAIGGNCLLPGEIDLFYNGVTFTIDNGAYTIEASGIPDHETHDFPTHYNPNTITVQVSVDTTCLLME